MNSLHQKHDTGDKPRSNRRVPLLAGAACVLILLLGIFSPRFKETPKPDVVVSGRTPNTSRSTGNYQDLMARLERKAKPPETAAQMVVRRLKLFSKQRRALVHRMAEHFKLTVPSEVDKFFDALNAGDWPEAQRLYKSLRDGDYDSAPADPALKQFWRPIQEAYGAAEQAQLWPAQQFLDYGNGILNSLAPGMVYVGGTDPGCFICTMLNATTDGDEHMTLTQNALADSSYLDYLRFTLGDSLNIPTDAQSQAAVAQYEQQSGQKTVNGPVAVMEVNNILVQDLLQNNPGLSFAMEESFPMSSLYAGAAPLGSIFALNANGDNTSAMTSDAAGQVVNYWQNMAQTLASTPDAANSWATMISYAHDAAAQGNLLAADNYPSQAEAAYQTALEISPNCADAAFGLAKVLAASGQNEQANQTLNTFLQNNPGQSQAVANFRSANLGNR